MRSLETFSLLLWEEWTIADTSGPLFFGFVNSGAFVLLEATSQPRFDTYENSTHGSPDTILTQILTQITVAVDGARGCPQTKRSGPGSGAK